MNVAAPTSLVVFGATGDLMEKKIAPALFKLFLNKKLPKLLRVIGVGRRGWDNLAYREYISTLLRQKYDPELPHIHAFASIFDYETGMFEDPTIYTKVEEKIKGIEKVWGVDCNKLYYLAVPPIHYKTIATNLSQSGLVKKQDLVNENDAYSRVIIEKPFGYDEATHKDLESFFDRLFAEDQIYRIDHYLGKQMFQNLLAFRFANTLFDGVWSSKYIAKIDIKILEKATIGDRGQFYDGLGALRDVGQNHILQMLSVATMDRPYAFSASGIRTARAKILESLPVYTPEQAVSFGFRAQYLGFREEANVNPKSNTETYFKIKTTLSHPNWVGTPITLEAGKGMKEDKKEIVITFKEPLFDDSFKSDLLGESTMLFKLSPLESIEFDLWGRSSGYEMEVSKKRFKLNERKTESQQYVAEYEHLLLAACRGDQTYFVSKEETKYGWGFVDPFVCAWENGLAPLSYYKAGTSEARDESAKFFVQLPPGIETYPHKKIGVVGLGKMGSAMVKKLSNLGWEVAAWNRSTKELDLGKNTTVVESLEGMVSALPTPRIVWMMLPAGEATKEVFGKLIELLSPSDIIINGANENYLVSKELENLAAKNKIEYVDVGVSGGPGGVASGSCLMIGGSKKMYEYLSPVYLSLAKVGGIVFCEGVGMGHFAKMIHNAVEYGMMQSLAEGLTMAASTIAPDKLLAAWSNGSVVEGKLTAWTKLAFEKWGKNLDGISGSVDSNGEADWALEFANKNNIPAWAIKAAVDFRSHSQANPSFTGQILSAIRGQFGGHTVGDKK